MMRENRILNIKWILKLAFVGSLLLNICFSSFASEMKIRPGVTGIWLQPDEKESPSFTWQSQWIWMDETIESDVMLARRSFDLDQVPQEAHLRITASSKYQLYLNGEYICQGPARSAPHHQSYDILDVTELLGEGKNSIAIRVHHQAGKRSYHHSGRAGLLAQLEISLNTREFSLISDTTWKVAPDFSWDNEAPRINRFKLAVNDRVDMRRQIKGWNEPGFDDASWSIAKPLIRIVGWPSPQKNARAQTLIPPWTSLVPRDIPYLLEADEQAVNLLAAMQIDEFVSEKQKGILSINPIPLSEQIDERIAGILPAYQNEGEPLVIPASDTPGTWLLLFDFGRVLNGMPKLEIEGTAGTMVDVLYAPFVINNQFTHKIVDSEFLDRIILSGNKDIWGATYFKPIRYMGVVVRSGNKPVRISAAGIRHIAYPFERKGYIHAPDAPWIEQYVEASARTIQVCTTDGYTDNYRERRQYAQTGYYAALGNYWIFGDLALQRRYLIQVAQEQEANGMMPAYAPLAGDDYMVIMDANCLWLRSLRNYFLYSGDTVTTMDLLPAARKLMGLLQTYTNALGLLDHPPYPYWLDHALNDRRGANFCLNGHYLGALEDFAQILAWLNEPGEEEYLARANLLRQSLRTHFWDNEQKLFSDALIDGERSDMFSEHANAMALAMHVATLAQAELVAKQLLASDQHNFIQRKSGMTMVTPAMSYFLHKGVCNYGYVEESFLMFRDRFDKMLAPDTNGTLWEEWWLDGTGRSGTLQKGRTRSDAQTESAFPPALFAEYLLGIRPIMPGMKKIELYRSHSGLRQVEGTVPSPEGKLFIRWNLDEDGSGELDVEVPGGMQVELDLASLGVPATKQIFINGRPSIPDTDRTPSYLLSGGRHEVKF
jgi:hypothetical protein